jgi:hypothetical protein
VEKMVVKYMKKINVYKYKDVKVIVGKRVKIECREKGEKKKKVEWEKNRNGFDLYKKKNVNSELKKKDVYEINSVKKEDEG